MVNISAQPPTIKLSSYSFFPQCIYGLCLILKINSETIKQLNVVIMKCCVSFVVGAELYILCIWALCFNGLFDEDCGFKCLTSCLVFYSTRTKSEFKIQKFASKI